MEAADLGDRIRAHRLQRGFTQNHIASALNVTAQAVSKWERGENAPDLFLMPSLAALLNTSVDTLLGYEHRTMRAVEGSVFFSGHTGFTAKGEKLAPEELAVYLNSHFYSITECMLQHAGLPIKYMGDAFLAVFVAGDYADNAIAAARAAHQVSQDSLVIGIASGSFFMGPIGHPDFSRLDVIGDNVNLAARVQAWAGKNSPSRMATTAETLALATCRVEVGPGVTTEIKGKVDPVTLHSVLA